jgi:hypothetical protein
MSDVKPQHRAKVVIVCRLVRPVEHLRSGDKKIIKDWCDYDWHDLSQIHFVHHKSHMYYCVMLISAILQNY